MLDAQNQTLRNLLLNMHGGLSPEALTLSEHDLLVYYYGSNYFNVLGYSEHNGHRRSKHDISIH